MGDIILKLNILSPGKGIIREFSGPSPSALIRRLPSFLKETFKLGSSEFFEDAIKWDVTGSDVDFMGQWRIKYGFMGDNFSKIWVTVKLIGKESKEKKVGNAKIYITGELKIKMPYDNSIQRMIGNIYLNLFYKKQIRTYIKMGEDRIKQLDNQIRNLFGAMVIE